MQIRVRIYPDHDLGPCFNEENKIQVLCCECPGSAICDSVTRVILSGWWVISHCGGVDVLTHCAERIFSAALRVIPARSWLPGVLEEGVNFLHLRPISGRLEVDFSEKNFLKGAFKTAHPGTFIPNDNDHSSGAALPHSLTGAVCVKQFYFTVGGNTSLKRYRGLDEQSLIFTEALCLDWAVILLDLTYAFIEEFQSMHGGFQGCIPTLCFVEAAIVDCQAGAKYFLVEEWIDTAKAPFTKYINNGLPVPCVPRDASVEVRNTADFLCFAQHVQFKFTEGLVYTSDYQGMSTNAASYVQ